MCSVAAVNASDFGRTSAKVRLLPHDTLDLRGHNQFAL